MKKTSRKFLIAIGSLLGILLAYWIFTNVTTPPWDLYSYRYRYDFGKFDDLQTCQTTQLKLDEDAGAQLQEDQNEAMLGNAAPVISNDASQREEDDYNAKMAAQDAVCRSSNGD